MHQGLLSWATRPIRQLLALSGNSSTFSSNSSDGTAVNSTGGSSTSSATKASLNPWYDQHLLTSAAGWASGLLYGSINSSSKVSLDAEGSGDVAGECSVLACLLRLWQVALAQHAMHRTKCVFTWLAHQPAYSPQFSLVSAIKHLP